MFCSVQENSAALSAAEGSGDGSAGMLQSGKHIHTAAGVWTCHRISPQTPAHRSGAQRQVQAVNTHTHTHSHISMTLSSNVFCVSGRVGEGRASWSLGNAYVSLEKHHQALHHARKHLEISREVRSHWFTAVTVLLGMCVTVWFALLRSETGTENWRPGWMWRNWWRF